MIGGGGIAGLSVRRGVGMLFLCKVVVMAVLALPHEDVVVELEASEFPFLRHEKLWQGDASGYLGRVEDWSCVDVDTAFSSLPLNCSVLGWDLALWRLDVAGRGG